MILKELNQPSNFLVSRLGLYNGWGVEFGVVKSPMRSTLTTLFSHTLLNLVFKNGFIFLSHPFRARIFLRLSGFYPLPKFFTVEDMYKFYRLHRVKARIFRTFKTTFILRKVFDKFIFNSVRIFSAGNWTLILGNALVPAPLKSNLNITALDFDKKIGFHRIHKNFLMLNSGALLLFLKFLSSSFFLRNV